MSAGWLGGEGGVGGGAPNSGDPLNARRRRAPGSRTSRPGTPQTQQIAAPNAPGLTTAPAPVPFSGPSKATQTDAPGAVPFSGQAGLGYAGQRVGAPGQVQGLADVDRIGAPAARAPSAALEYGGPMEVSYRGQRVNPHGMVQAQNDVERIGAGQIGQYRIDPNARTRQGQYFQGPDAFRGLPSLGQFAGDADRLEGATFQRGMNRLAPGMQEQQQRLGQQLDQMGVPIGSEAYNAEMNRLARSQNDARENLALSAIGAGRQEHSRMMGLAQALAGQGFGQNLASLQFGAGEQGRRVREGLATSDSDFSQRLAATGLDSTESARRFQELMAGQGQQHGLNQINRQFTANERGRDFNEGLASENQFFNQNLAADNFAADAAKFAHQSAVQQQQYGDTFGAQQDQNRFSNLLAGQGQQHALNLGNRQFELGAQGQRFNQQLGAEGQYFNQGLARDQFGAQQALNRDQFDLGQQQWNADFGRQANQFADSFGAQQALNRDQFGLGQDQWNTQWNGNQAQNQFNNQMAQGAFNAGENQRGMDNYFQQQALNNQRYMADRQARSQDRGSAWSGIAGIAGSILPFVLSDERTKLDHGVIDTVDVGGAHVPVHEFEYHGDPTRRTGLMAGELQRVRPDAVQTGGDGLKRINLAQLIGATA